MKVLDSLFSDHHSYTSNKKWDWKSEIESEEHTPILDPGFRIPVRSTITVPAMKESDTFEFDTQRKTTRRKTTENVIFPREKEVETNFAPAPQGQSNDRPPENNSVNGTYQDQKVTMQSSLETSGLRIDVKTETRSLPKSPRRITERCQATESSKK